MNLLVRLVLFLFSIAWWTILIVIALQDRIDGWWFIGLALNSTLTVAQLVWIGQLNALVHSQAQAIDDFASHARRPAKFRKEPPPGLLMSIAMRLDHGLGCPGYYDQPIFSRDKISHRERLNATLITARQVYEEVTGQGFYSPEREDEYIRLMTAHEREHGE